MTLIGAFRVQNAVVLLADRQETIADYAKWDAGKIYLWEYSNQYRVLMASCGNSVQPINQIWEELVEGSGHMVSGFKQSWPAYPEVKRRIIETVARVTKKTIFPVPSDQRPHVELIWAIQPLGQTVLQSSGGIDLFVTYGLSVNGISHHYFSGNPVLLAKYLADMYLEHIIFAANEAEALAAYILWEAGEYDPTVGKYSDIFTLRWPHGEISRVTVPELKYWDDHFRLLKESLRLVPLLSCISDPHIKQIYNQRDRLARLTTTIKTLAKEQEKMRSEKKGERSKLETKLLLNLKKTAARYNKPQPATTK